MSHSPGNKSLKSSDQTKLEVERNSGYDTSSSADDDHFSDAQEGPSEPTSATTISDDISFKVDPETKPSDPSLSAIDAPPQSSSGPSSAPLINTVIPPVSDGAIDNDHTPTQTLPERPLTASPSSDPQPIIVRWNDKRDVIRPKVSGEKERIEQLVKQERDRSVSPSISSSSLKRRASDVSDGKPLDLGISVEGRADTSPLPSPHLSPLDARFGRSPIRSPTRALSPILGSAPDTPHLSLKETSESTTEEPKKPEEEPVEVKNEVVGDVQVVEQSNQESKENVAPEDDETPLEATSEEPAQNPVESSTNFSTGNIVVDHFEEYTIEPAAEIEASTSDEAPAEEDDGFGSMGDDDDGFGDDDFDDFGEMGETAAGDDDGFDDFDAFEEVDPSESFAEPAPPPQSQPTFVVPEIPVPILDFEAPDELSQALTAAMDKMFPTDPSLKRKPSTVEGRTFLTERSHSLWNQLCAPPPLQPPNWKVSRIRRLFLVSLGVPVDLDEILPAETKQKKLVLPSMHPVDDYNSYTSSPASSRNDHHNASSSSTSATNNNNNNDSRSHNGSSAADNKDGDQAHSGSNGGKGQARPRSLDVNSARILCSTSDVALEGYTVEELKAHIGKLKETTEMASEVLTFWLEKRNSAMGDKETFETVIESLVGYARKKRQNG